jgi:flagellar biosynthesis/type III secretory pathway chaperone
METDLVRTLEACLGQEQLHLLRGEIEPLSELGGKRRQIMDALEAADRIDPEVLARLQRLARRNMAMIEAALRGVRSARLRIEEIRRVSRSLDTYSAKGAMENLGDAHRNVERRA